MAKLNEACDAILDRIIKVAKQDADDLGPEIRNLAGAYEGLINAKRNS